MNRTLTYASSFVTFFLTNIKKTENTVRIILFGSVAHDEATKESDVDLFIEVKKKTKALEEEIRTIEESYYQSREAAIFKAQGIENKFSIKIGKLQEWKDLAPSIESTGIVLYGLYETNEIPAKAKRWLIAYWNKIGKNRGAFLNKLYGVTIQQKKYLGLLSRTGGRKLGKSCIMLPMAAKKDFFLLARKHKVEARVQEVLSE